MPAIQIWHNPKCSKSRRALELLKDAGHDVDIVLYLESPPGPERIGEVLDLLGVEPRKLMRTNEAEYAELGLADSNLDRPALVRALSEHPILIERPVVIAGRRAVIARPPERALEVV